MSDEEFKTLIKKEIFEVVTQYFPDEIKFNDFLEIIFLFSEIIMGMCLKAKRNPIKFREYLDVLDQTYCTLFTEKLFAEDIEN